MLKYKIDIEDALKKVKFTTYKAKVSGVLSQDTLRKLKNGDTNVSLEALNRLCIILDMDIKDIIRYEENEEEKRRFSW